MSFCMSLCRIAALLCPTTALFRASREGTSALGAPTYRASLQSFTMSKYLHSASRRLSSSPQHYCHHCCPVLGHPHSPQTLLILVHILTGLLQGNVALCTLSGCSATAADVHHSGKAAFKRMVMAIATALQGLTMVGDIFVDPFLTQEGSCTRRAASMVCRLHTWGDSAQWWVKVAM